MHGRADFIRETKDMPFPFSHPYPEPSDRNKYYNLAERQYWAFLNDSDSPDSSGIRHGFHVIGRLLSQVPPAYAEHLRSNQEDRDLPELSKTLVDSFDEAVGQLADMDNRRNKTYETWLALSGANPLGDGPAYEFERRDGELTFKPKDSNIAEARLDIAHRTISGDLEPKDTREKCPALAFILPKIWGVMAVGCAVNRAYFDFDINQELAKHTPDS